MTYSSGIRQIHTERDALNRHTTALNSRYVEDPITVKDFCFKLYELDKGLVNWVSGVMAHVKTEALSI